MERVYILEDGVYLRKNGDNLVLTKNRQTLEEIPVRNLKQMVLAGYAALSGSVLQVLMQNRVETVFLDKNWRFQGRLNVDEHKHVQRRIDQYRNLSDPEFVAESARILVHGKLENMARMLQVRGKRMKNQELLSKAAAIRALGKELGSLQDVELIRGCEGHASRLYFQVFDHLLTNKNFSFKGRSKRPPKDPVNALLSFVYTLLTNEVQTAVKTVGLDPYLGALHVIDYGRPSLACDLVEEWRAFLGDRLVLGLINKKSISVDDFVYRDVKDTDFVDEKDLRSKRPVEMKPAICRAFLQSYEKWMQQKILDPVSGKEFGCREYIFKQVQRFEKHLSQKEKYQPFLWAGRV